MKLSIRKTIMVGLAFFTICIFWEAYDNLMPLFLANFELSKTAIGIIMALDNIIALVLLPFMGILSDHTKSKFGRRIPFIVTGSILAASTLLLVNFAHNAHLLWLLILSTVFLLVFMCLYRTPAVSLMPDITPKPLRSKANAIINIMGLVGGVTFLILTMTPLYQVVKDSAGDVVGVKTGNWGLIGIVAALIIAAAVFMFWRVKEVKLVEEREKMEKEAGIFEDAETEKGDSAVDSKTSPISTIGSEGEESTEKLKITAEIQNTDKSTADENKDSLSAKKKGGLWLGFKRNFGGLDKGQQKSLIFLMLSVTLWFLGYNAAKTWFSTVSMELFNGKFATPLLVANIAGFIMYIPSSIIGSKIGRKKTVLLGLSLVLAGFLMATLFVFVIRDAKLFNALFIVVFIFVGAGWATLNVHSYVMSVEMAKKSNTGFFTGLYYTFSMGAQALTPIISGAFIDAIGINSLFPYCALFIALSIVTMTFVKHGNAKVIDNRSMLEKLDLED